MQAPVHMMLPAGGPVVLTLLLGEAPLDDDAPMEAIWPGSQ